MLEGIEVLFRSHRQAMIVKTGQMYLATTTANDQSSLSTFELPRYIHARPDSNAALSSNALSHALPLQHLIVPHCIARQSDPGSLINQQRQLVTKDPAY